MDSRNPHSARRLILPALFAASLPGVGALCAQPILQHDEVDFAAGVPEAIVEKAARIVASPRQMMFHALEYTCFIHFGINTYTGREWGSGKENAAQFNPGDTLDTDQWCRVAKEAGMTLVLITVKHHDGFCLWQTRYNDRFSVQGIPWREGKGDVLRELADSCRKHGLKMGVYLSPADLFQIEDADGHYGNLSKAQPTRVPTDPATFRSDPTRVRADKPGGAPVIETVADDYNRYFMNQLYELLTEYGPIHEVWFDGAHPKRKGGQTYIKDEWFRLIRTLAPEAVIAVTGPDVRWCGNESGATRAVEWNVLPVVDQTHANLYADGRNRHQDIGSAKAITVGARAQKPIPRHLWYLVCEVDTSIRAGWFWRDEDKQAVRPADDVFDIYERSVGGNSVFLLNIPPDPHGRFGDRDVASLVEAGRRIRETYGDASLMAGATSPAARVLDGDITSYWQPEGGSGEFLIQLPEARTLNRFVLQEPVGVIGQRVKQHALDAYVDGQWHEVARAATIGYKRILRFPSVTTDRMRVRILAARLTPAVATVSAHYYQAPPPSVRIGRDAAGRISITAPPAPTFAWKGHRSCAGASDETPRIHYTTDGVTPTAASPQYEKTFSLPDGGLVKAVAILGQQAGAVGEMRFGLLPTGWKIVSVSSAHNPQFGADKAIDGDPNTQWHTDWSKEPPPAHPHTLVIDLGKTHSLTGFTYLPRRGHVHGLVESGEIAFSLDGETWTQPVSFHFGNLLNDPSQRTLHLDGPPVPARYFRFVTRTGAQGNPYGGAAEIGLLVAPPAPASAPASVAPPPPAPPPASQNLGNPCSEQDLRSDEKIW